MKEKELYTIGKMSKICNLPKKTLRFYDRNEIIKPDLVDEENGYRYYSRETMYSVPPLKYFKDMGFTLEEIKVFLSKPPFEIYEQYFREKKHMLEEEQREINLKVKLIKDWYDLIIEARLVLDSKIDEVTVKVLPKRYFLPLEQEFSYNYIKSIINIEYTNYITECKNQIIGPVIIKYPSLDEKMNGTCKKMFIMQETIDNQGRCKSTELGGFLVASCYHIGGFENISETYEKIIKYVEENNYKRRPAVFERHVTDYWLTQDTDKFVTEIFVIIEKRK